MKSKHIVIPVFIPHKGCPFDCIYCNQKSISGQIEELNEEEIRNIIESHLNSAQEGSYIEIGFYGGSFTGIDKELQERYLEIAYDYIRDGRVQEIRLSTRPDYINTHILDRLKRYNVRTIELGVQSMDEDVLKKTCRGHSTDDVIASSRLIKDYGFNLGIQTMIGLPGDSEDKALKTAKRVIEIGPKIVRIYPTMVVRDTYLEKMYLEGEYKPLSLNETVNLCAKLLDMYESNGIKVIRIGLQPTDNIKEGGDIIAGPFHPAIRQLVESRLMLGKIERMVTDSKFENKSDITIYTKASNISNVVGQNRENINYLKEKFRFKSITVKGSGTNELIIIE